MMAVGETVRWLESEDRFLDWLVGEQLVGGRGAAVLIVPEGVSAEDVAQSVWTRLIDKPHHFGDSSFIKEWARIEDREHPASAISGVFMTERPVSSAYDLVTFARGIPHAPLASGVEPLFAIFYDVSVPANGNGTPQAFRAWLEGWAHYLEAINGAARGGGLGVRCEVRVLFVMRPQVSLARTGDDLPSLFCVFRWPDPSEEELWDYARARIAGDMVNLKTDQRRFLLMKAMDMAGLSKADLKAALDLANDARRASPGDDDWLDDLGWTPLHGRVQEAVAKLRGFGTGLKRIEPVVAMGGRLHEAAPSWLMRDVKSIADELWILGLWTWRESSKHSGALTPVALAALKALQEEDGGGFPIRIPVPLPQEDRAALDLLDRCLVIERLLKERLIAMARASRDLRERLWGILRRIADDKDFDDRRFVKILRSVLEERWFGESDLDVVREATLRSFLHIYAEALGIDLPDTLESFTGIRNQLAHGKRATWKMYRDFAALERDFVQLGLAESRV